MSSASILLLAKEVAALANLAQGHERATACTQPRRRCWDAVASIQRSLKPLSGSLAPLAGWQQSQAQEAFDCCKDLSRAIERLQGLDESGESHWAQTEYSVLVQEVDLQTTKARQLLGLEGDDDLRNDSRRVESSHASSQPCVEESATPLDDEQGHEKEKQGAAVIRKPIRLSAEELQEEEDHICELALNGKCEGGCTVGHCQAHMVEAW